MSPVFGSKRLKPEEFKNLVALRARGFLPKIRRFIEGEYAHRREMLGVLGGLVSQLEKPLEVLERRSPLRYVGFRQPWRILSNHLEAEVVVEAFLKGREMPSDRFGNPKMLGGVYTGLLGILLAICAGLKGFRSWGDWGGTRFHALMRSADDALGRTAVQTPADLKRLLPLIKAAERELAKFPSKKKLERLIKQ